MHSSHSSWNLTSLEIESTKESFLHWPRKKRKNSRFVINMLKSSWCVIRNWVYQLDKIKNPFTNQIRCQFIFISGYDWNYFNFISLPNSYIDKLGAFLFYNRMQTSRLIRHRICMPRRHDHKWFNRRYLVGKEKAW